MDWLPVPGILVRGHGVASGQGITPYPLGSLAMQKPFFAERGLNLDGLFEGTLNVSIQPRRWRLVNPSLTFERVAWTHLHPPETFSFSPARMTFGPHTHEGWIYYPHPETKATHFQDPSVVELLMPWIAGLALGASVVLALPAPDCELLDGAA